MAYDRDSFLSGLAVGRTLWRPYRNTKTDFSFLIDTRYSSSGNTFGFALAAPSNVTIVFWGDGSYDLVPEPYENSWHNMQHTYSVGGLYLICISGGIWQINFGRWISEYNLTPECLISVNNPLKIHESLHSRYGWTAVLEADSMFSGCSHLVHLPRELFSGYKNAAFPSYYYVYFNSVDSMFENCSSLPVFPERLFYGIESCPSAWHMCYNCVSLTALPTDLFSYGFDSCNSFRECFYCRDEEWWPVQNAITSTVPELWNTHPNANGYACYYSCQNAANYSDIPYYWGGPST